MKVKERENIIRRLNAWENEFPLEKWKIEGIHIWPIIKRNIFFNLYYKSTHTPTIGRRKIPLYQRIIRKLSRKPKAWLYYRSLKLKKTDFLFSGAPSHRIAWEGKQYNRYFEPLMDYLASKGQASYLLEYKSINVEKLYEAQRVIDLTRLLPLFMKKIDRENFFQNIKVLPGYNLFLKEMSEVTGLSTNHFNENLFGNLQKILSWSSLYQSILKKTEARYIFGLCYYNNEMLGMNLAARRLSVNSVDMQHGTQGDLHFGYLFNKMPEEGFNILPKYFWLWDESSFKGIEKWVGENHLPLLGGNPWIEYLDSIEDRGVSRNEKPMVLFTLQPLNPVIDDYFLKVIALTIKEYDWWLRLHPRMTEAETSQLMDKLAALHLDQSVHLEKSASVSLPFLLKSCDLHISKYSGSVGEAALLGKISLIIDEIGVRSFKDLMHSGKAVACIEEDPKKVIEVMQNLIVNSKLKDEEKKLMPRYKNIMDELIKEI